MPSQGWNPRCSSLPSSPYLASHYECPWLWPADHLLAWPHSLALPSPIALSSKWPEVPTPWVGQSFSKYTQNPPYWSPQCHPCPLESILTIAARVSLLQSELGHVPLLLTHSRGQRPYLIFPFPLPSLTSSSTCPPSLFPSSLTDLLTDPPTHHPLFCLRAFALAVPSSQSALPIDIHMVALTSFASLFEGHLFGEAIPSHSITSLCFLLNTHSMLYFFLFIICLYR